MTKVVVGWEREGRVLASQADEISFASLRDVKL
jgi:hypothetical protein